jgi:nicotinamide-nucleotide amidase
MADLSADIIQTARDKGLRIATAESCTGGMVSAALTDIAGSSAVFERGFVTYSNEAKIDLLGVSPETLAAFGAVSNEVAREMALGAKTRAGVDMAVSITGIAGPGGSAHKPEGRVCFGLSSPAGVALEQVDFGALGRANVRIAARDYALRLLHHAISQSD